MKTANECFQLTFLALGNAAETGDIQLDNNDGMIPRSVNHIVIVQYQHMKNKKKSFFYNPQFRIMVYTVTGIYILTFKALILAYPNWWDKIDSYQTGDNGSAMFIGFVSGFVFNLIYILFSFHERIWNIEMIFYSVVFYVLTGLLGFLSLIKFRDYQDEIDNQR